MNISLTAELQQWIQNKVKSGNYSSVDEAIGEGLRLLDERDRLRDARLAELKEKIKVGIEELDRGEGTDGEEFFAELDRKSKFYR